MLKLTPKAKFLALEKLFNLTKKADTTFAPSELSH